MKKIKINDCICHSKIKNHLHIKNLILSEIDKCVDDKMNTLDSYHTDSISKLDWNKSNDIERPWVKIFLSEFGKDIQEVISGMAYSTINVVDIWYQQYLEGDTHGWHIHGQHFTGVYYLEFPKGCSAHYIHRGLPNTKKRKTIISYNFDLITNDGLDLNLIKKKNPNTWGS